MAVGASTISAGAVVYSAVEDATACLWRDVADTSADVIGYKYGEEAGTTARDGMHAVGNIYEIKACVSRKALATFLVAKSAEDLTVDCYAHPVAMIAVGTCDAPPVAMVSAVPVPATNGTPADASAEQP
eukprot:NODE_15116_length_1067_cov_3.600000.p2 GENE.NODE_15116_length_1067_cov_3.600000~~NODE_15116_length_1067_cov_3.600000.p2  ORF type:complete len:129 (-),score=15.63 NODE_15116_length_1067_cov_3.600000:487-873(-)